MDKVILASQSPRRKQLLGHILSSFSIASADIDETPLEDESAQDYVERLALEKAKKIAVNHPNDIVIGSDTTVVFEQEILGKPENFEDCRRMLSLLSANQHQTLTAFALVKGDKEYVETVVTQVEFKTISEKEIKQYWQTNEPQDKAGSYAIQGIGGKFVKAIQGSVSAVVGLPLVELQQALSSQMMYECE